MTIQDKTILVLGATGQQGGSVANALSRDGWAVRALVRDPASENARALAAMGVDLVRGDLADAASLERATAGVYGVFSVQPSSGQGALYDVTDAMEIQFGKAVADAAVAAGARHLVYTSSNAAGAPTGVGHFDSKTAVENHVRALPIDSTILRPSTFMEILLMPDFGLAEGHLTFFNRPDQTMQFIAVEDIGHMAAHVFADRSGFAGRTLEIAGDELTGDQIAAAFSRAMGRPIVYRRFSDTALQESDFLRSLARLVDAGPLAGGADLDALRRIHPGLSTFDAWLEGAGRSALLAAMA